VQTGALAHPSPTSSRPVKTEAKSSPIVSRSTEVRRPVRSNCTGSSRSVPRRRCGVCRRGFGRLPSGSWWRPTRTTRTARLPQSDCRVSVASDRGRVEPAGHLPATQAVATGQAALHRSATQTNPEHEIHCQLNVATIILLQCAGELGGHTHVPTPPGTSNRGGGLAGSSTTAARGTSY